MRSWPTGDGASHHRPASCEAGLHERACNLDVERAIADLTTLASNYRWTWRQSAAAVLEAIPTFAPGLHPLDAVRRLSPKDLAALVETAAWTQALESETSALQRLVEEAPQPRVAYLSPEFAVSEVIPQYSGGLGILAGDHLKAASDIGMPIVGVGLFYHRGFFRQVIDSRGQSERYERHDPAEYGCYDTGVVVEVPMAGRSVRARVWRLDIGASPLLLLDTALEGNRREEVAICDRLYGADRAVRLRQELLLGIGGVRALREVGWSPTVVHLNEGHAGFAVFGLVDEALREGATFEEALDEVRQRLVFTTHTPVPAGIEEFDRSLVAPHAGVWADRWGLPLERVLELGADPVRGIDKFSMTALCLRHARAANGVSQLHGEVSRGLFAAIPGGKAISSVTNGVHARSWTHPAMQRVFDKDLGAGWADGDPGSWQRVDDIDDRSLIAARRAGRETLASLVEERTGHAIDQDALVVGFARRFAPYKRPTLLLRDRDRLAALLRDESAPIRLVYAGKAHPADSRGKELLAELIAVGRSPEVSGRLVFVPGYDMAVARAMVAGCDVWLNTPIRTREASGTSGEKAALNGVLNCSTADGWWAEMCDGDNGWVIPESRLASAEARDDEEAMSAMEILAAAAVEYYGDGGARFRTRIRDAWKSLGPRVTAARMLRDYRDRIYRPEPSRL